MTMAAMPTAFSRQVSPARAPEIRTGARVSTARISVMRMSASELLSTSLIPVRMRESIFPTLVSGCPLMSRMSPADPAAAMILSAPSSRLMVTFLSP